MRRRITVCFTDTYSMRLFNKFFAGLIIVMFVVGFISQSYANNPLSSSFVSFADDGWAGWENTSPRQHPPYITLQDSIDEFRERPTGSPATFRLGQNYPNPFNPSTVIRFEIIRAVDVQLSVFDMLGRKVATLVNERRTAGQYEVRWVAEGVPAGVYFYHLKAGGFSETRSLTVLK